MSIEWFSHFHTIQPIPAWPRLIAMAVETQSSPAYRLDGATREESGYCVYQHTLSGAGIFEKGTQRTRVGPGEGFLFNMADSDVRYYYPEDAERPWRFFYVSFEGDNAERVVHDITARYGSVHGPSRGRKMVDRILDFKRHDDAHQNIFATEAARFVTDLFGDIIRSHEKALAAARPGRLVRRAQDEIERRIGENLNVTMLADILQVSREHLTRAFMKELAIPPYEFIVNYKMQLARHYLQHTNLTCKEIARDLGFRSAPQFSDVFRRECGIAPKVWRLRGTTPD